MGFAKDLSDGLKAQIEFSKLLLDTEKVISLEFAQGRFPDWDIKLTTPDGEKTYEVKSDRQAQDTGNYVVEYSYKGKPSGIFTSKADYIVYYVKGERRISERGALILGLINAEKRTTKGGDGWASSLWVLKCETLPDLFAKIKTNEQGGEENA